MIRSFRNAISQIALRIRVGIFGNNHSFLVNLRYAFYHRAAAKKWRPVQISDAAKKDANQFTQEGWAVLPSSVNDQLALEVGQRVDALFDGGGEGVIKVSDGLFRLVDGVEKVPEVSRFVAGHVEQVIENFFQSHFKIYNVSFYRTIPNPAVPESSFLWHFDNAPDEEIKLMIYFDHVYEDTGAFRFKNREFSEGLRKDGFWHRKNYYKVSNRLDDATTTICVEGKPGTTILFQNGRVAHKATAPRRLHRDIATMVIIPSLIPWREHFSRNKHLLSTNAGLCKNPWTDEPENIGYRY